MLKLSRINGLQMFGLFLSVTMVVFFAVSYLSVRYQAVVSINELEKNNTRLKVVAAKQYLEQYLYNVEDIAFSIASQNVVAATVLGGIATQEEIRDRLQIAKPISGQHDILLVDIAGTIIYQEFELSEKLIKRLGRFSEQMNQSSDTVFFKHNTRDYLSVTVPIFYNGFQEGVLVYVTPFDVDAFFTPLQINDSHWFGIVQTKQNWGMNVPKDWALHTEYIIKYDLDLVYGVNPIVYENKQKTFLRSLLFAVGGSAFVTFCLVYFFGKKVLVSPYEKLARSERELEIKTRRLVAQEKETRRLANVALYMLDAIVITDAHGRITWTNKAFETLSGYTFDEVKNKKPSSFLQGELTDKNETDRIRDAINKTEPYKGQLINYTKQNEAYWVEISLVPLIENGVLEGFIAIERDVSKQKILQEQLNESLLKAQSANVAKSQFLASMSHELRTPMNGVLGNVQLLSESSLEAQQREWLSHLEESGKHMLNLLNDILDFSKVEAGELTLESTDFYLHQIASKVERYFYPGCQDKGLLLKVHCDSHEELIVVLDETRLMQIIINLMSNAVKFTSRGSIDCHLTHVVNNEENTLLIEVKDTGIGISQDKQAEIFAPFRQADNSTTRAHGGTGLGLAITAKLVTLMGGTITLESQKNVGSLFAVSLPIKVGKKRKIREETHTAAYDGHGKKVLIVEDSEINTILLQQFLSRRGFDCDTAKDGEMAVDKASKATYDLVMMDSHMPGIDGAEATKRIRLESPKDMQPVIIGCTADVLEENQTRMLQSGCNAVITKPVKTDVLDGVLYQFL